MEKHCDESFGAALGLCQEAICGCVCFVFYAFVYIIAVFFVAYLIL